MVVVVGAMVVVVVGATVVVVGGAVVVLEMGTSVVLVLASVVVDPQLTLPSMPAGGGQHGLTLPRIPAVFCGQHCAILPTAAFGMQHGFVVELTKPFIGATQVGWSPVAFAGELKPTTPMMPMTEPSSRPTAMMVRRTRPDR